MEDIITTLRALSLGLPCIGGIIEEFEAIELGQEPVDQRIYDIYNSLPSEIQVIWAQPDRPELGMLRMNITSINAIQEPVYAWGLLFRMFIEQYKTASKERIETFIVEFKRCRAAFAYEIKRLSQEIVEEPDEEFLRLKRKVLDLAIEYSRLVDKMIPVFKEARDLIGKTEEKQGS
ncbi:hypothetical protein Dda_0059 [Drechslerella dactyloides]|uniref:Uncharacterized protein n=1 Tax=Drechslerella dactyloides TaxID=74499 RepID=A0AAD6J7J5_DREDA|nr:hypothetical protein Dda_0059 [Drechslerella dactyloides]